MNIGAILILVLVILAITGGFGGFYPHPVGFGLGGLLVIILVVLLLTGRL